MKLICLFSFLFVVGLHQTTAQTLLFKSGFEEGVTLEPPVAFSGQWYQYFTGTDSETGFEWPQDLPTNDTTDGYWTFKVPDTTSLSDYAEVKIDTLIGHDGDLTRATQMRIMDYDPTNFDDDMAGHVRCEYRINVDSTLKHYYMKYWMKVQPDLYTLMPYGTGRWRMFSEWFESGDPHSDYRWSLYMRTGTFSSDSTSAHWRLSSDYQLGPTGPFETDTICNQQVVTPTDEWFKVEIFWNQQNDSSGRVWVALNGNTIIDKWGPNMNDTSASSMSNWQIFKLYVDEPTMDDGDVYQWVDDVEIWDTIPPGVATIDKETVIDNKNDFFVYPNPASSKLIIQNSAVGSSLDIRLLTTQGKEVIRKTSDDPNIVLYTNDIPAGLYFLHVSSKNTPLKIKKVFIE